MSHANEIAQTEDIVALADLMRDMVKGADVTDCHTFMKSIFKVPGTLKRQELDQIRLRIRQEMLLNSRQ